MSLRKDQVYHMQFDDLISSVHTKLKPVSISIALDAQRRFVLGAEVGSIPAFGHLAELSRKKYGRRLNEHKEKLDQLFQQIAPAKHQNAKIHSDEHRNYADAVYKFFPETLYTRLIRRTWCTCKKSDMLKNHLDILICYYNHYYLLK